MGRGPNLSKKSRKLIVETYMDHPKWSTIEIRNTVRYEIQNENPLYKNKWPEFPGKRVVEKVLQEAKKHKENPNSQDILWSIKALDKYPISPQVLPSVLSKYKWHIDNGTDFTIRQAKWVARLSSTQYSESGLPILIARTEQLYEMMGESVDLEIFTRLLAGLPGQADDWQMAFTAMMDLAGLIKKKDIKAKTS